MKIVVSWNLIWCLYDEFPQKYTDKFLSIIRYMAYCIQHFCWWCNLYYLSNLLLHTYSFFNVLLFLILYFLLFHAFHTHTHTHTFIILTLKLSYLLPNNTRKLDTTRRQNYCTRFTFNFVLFNVLSDKTLELSLEQLAGNQSVDKCTVCVDIMFYNALYAIEASSKELLFTIIAITPKQVGSNSPI